MKKIEKSQVEFEIEILAKDVEKYFEKATIELSKNIDIKGFRKGKVPQNILEKNIGRSVIFEKAAEFAISEEYLKYIKKENLEVVDYPSVTVKKIAEGNPVVANIKVAVFPEIELGEYKKIIEKEAKNRNKKIEVNEKEIQSNLEYLQSSRAKEKEVKRPAKKNDLVEVDFEVRLDGVKIEGGESKNHPVKIGAGKFMPGFEDTLVGLKEGEEKDFKITAPKDYFKKNLAGKKLDFHVKINKVFEVEMPEINDDFAKSFGDFKNLEELKKNIYEGTKKQKEEKEKEEYINNLIKKLTENSKIDLPEVMIEREKDKIISEIKADISQHGLDFNTYLTSIKKTEKDLKADLQNQAETRIKSVLVLQEIAKQENIKITDKEITEKTNELLERYPEKEREKINTNQLKEYAKSNILNQKVLELLEK